MIQAAYHRYVESRLMLRNIHEHTTTNAMNYTDFVSYALAIAARYEPVCLTSNSSVIYGIKYSYLEAWLIRLWANGCATA